MIYKTVSFVALIILFLGCSDMPLTTTSQVLNQNSITDCDDKPCPQIAVDYIVYNGEDEIVTPINSNIKKFAIASLYLGDPASEPTATTIKEAIAAFIKDYWRDTSEFPDIHEYEAEVFIEETFRSTTFASVALSQYKYTGGAHGYGTINYTNFDIETGEIITNNALIKDQVGLAAMAEQQLRKDYKIADDKGLNAAIFWFENDTFYLPDNIGFENGQMSIHYNQYEIASYADGPIDIKLPLEDVAPFLNYEIKK